MKPQKIIGILGGMGPAATASFFNDIIKISQEKYNAEQDTDYPIIYLYNTALDGFNETGFEKPNIVKKQLIKDNKKLENWGADFIVMPCNTVHHFAKDIKKHIKIPLISIIESTITSIKKTNYKKIGIVSSSSTRHLKLYENNLKKEKLITIKANKNEQKLLDQVILSAMMGNQGIKEKNIMKKIILRMKKSGAQAVVLGCTELPLAISQDDIDFPLFNTIHILAESAVDFSYKE